jgi:hypothetical protein
VALCHPSTIIRRQFLEQYSLRYCKGCEDWDMWCRGALHFQIVNIPQVLLYYRTRNYPKNLDDSELKTAQYEPFYEIDKKNLKALNLQPTEVESLIHRRLGSLDLKKDSAFVFAANMWLHKLYSANKIVDIYPQSTFHQVLAEYWLAVCNNTSSSSLQTWNKFFNSPYLEIGSLNRRVKVNIFVKWFVKQGYFFIKRALVVSKPKEHSS